MAKNQSPYDPNILPPEFDGMNQPQNDAEVGAGLSPVASGAKRGVFVIFLMASVAAGAGYYFYSSSEESKPVVPPPTQVDTTTTEADPEDDNIPTVTPNENNGGEKPPQVVSPPSEPVLPTDGTSVNVSSLPPIEDNTSFIDNIALPNPPFISPPEPPGPTTVVNDPVIEEDGPPLPPAPPGIGGEPPTKDPPGNISDEDLKKLDARRRANMIKMNSSQGPSGSSSGFAGLDPTNSAVQISAAEKANAAYIGKNSFIIAQGKIIDAVMETAINTDIPGTLRAIVSRDIYAESGKLVLIPRGSRLVGSYDAEIKRGQKRVYVIWQRVLRPDGIDVEIKSPGTDSLGRAGVAATTIDNRYFEIFGNSLLLSTLTIGGALALDKVTESQGVTSSASSGGTSGGTTTTTSGQTTDLAVSGTVKDIAEVTKSIAQSFANVKPTITVDQGTRIKVFVNRDLIFPASVSTGITVLP
jgi:type IV secretion system protein VirB10